MREQQYALMYHHDAGRLTPVRAHPVKPGTWTGFAHFVEPLGPDGFIHYGGPLMLGETLFAHRDQAVMACLQSVVDGVHQKLSALCVE